MAFAFLGLETIFQMVQVREKDLGSEDNNFSSTFTQCGNFMIFLSLRFYVKSISGIVEVHNLPF